MVSEAQGQFTYTCTPFENKREMRCGLEIAAFDDFTLVVATELRDNLGPSVTNAAEHLATHVCRSFGIPLRRLVWLEHYPSDEFRHVRSECDLVQFGLDIRQEQLVEPMWIPLTGDEVETYRDGRLPELPAGRRVLSLRDRTGR